MISPNVIKILKSAHAVLSQKALDEQINAIYSNIKNIYNDISDASLCAAREVISLSNSDGELDKSLEIAIPHLVTSYRIVEKSLHQYKKVRLFLIFTTDEPLISRNERSNYLAYMAALAGYICICYMKINKNNIASTWKELSLKNYRESLDLFYFDPDNLEQIDPSYVWIDKETIFTSDHQAYSVSSKVMSQEGRDFAYSKTDSEMSEFEEWLNQTKIELCKQL